MLEEGQDTESGVPVRIEHVFTEPPISQFANHLIVQHTEHEFILSFFEIDNPIILGDEDKTKLEQLESVRAYCVARVAVPTGRMASFVEALENNLAKYQQKFSEEEE